MARRLVSKPNTIPASGAYPYGDVKDNTGSNDGTNVDKLLVADFLQFFERLMAVGGITANELPENSSNGFQYQQALNAVINALTAIQVASEASTRAAADSAESSSRASADTALQNNINLKANAANPALTGTITKNGINLPVCVCHAKLDFGGGGGNLVLFYQGITITAAATASSYEITVTHNIGNTNYTVQVSAISAASGSIDYVTVESISNNTFKIVNATTAGLSQTFITIFKL